jgi:hypothetical protein
MYCPRCGSKLELLEKSKNSTLEREEYKCTRVPHPCFDWDCPLYFHQPFQGINSAPGDSWSLSWIK